MISPVVSTCSADWHLVKNAGNSTYVYHGRQRHLDYLWPFLNSGPDSSSRVEGDALSAVTLDPEHNTQVAMVLLHCPNLLIIDIKVFRLDLTTLSNIRYFSTTFASSI